ncbi:MAG: alpha/beta hydrolase [Dehalococcoidia bacterium]|nr:alpha/beta hydrolase [Dehalococcoidia bacterium]
MSSQLAQINGFRLRYRIEGKGPLAVFGHGLMGSIEQIDEAHAQLSALHDRVRLLTYDARGHGQSEGPRNPAGYTWETLGQDMCGLIAHAGDEQAIVGGASMGAATALWVALERPELVRALVLAMPPPLGHHSMREEAERQAVTVLDMLAAAVENYGLEKTVELARMMPGFAANPEDAEARVKWLLAQNPLALSYGVRGLLQAPFHDPALYATIRVPTLVICHEGDGLHPARAGELLRSHIPDCELHVAPGVTHWRDNAGDFLNIITRFLDRVS